MLTEEQKKVGVDVCTDLLSRLQAEPQTFLDRVVTQDEMWVHHFDTETIRQNGKVLYGSMSLFPPRRNSRLPYQQSRRLWRRYFGTVKEL